MGKVEVFRGFLGDDGITLFETVQFALHTGLPGELVFRKHKSRIFLREGLVVGAELEPFRGEKALERIWLRTSRDVVSFFTTSDVRDDRLRISEVDLLSVQERIDGFRVLLQDFPPTTRVQLVSPPRERNEIGAALVSLLSGHEKGLPLQEILDRLPFSDTLILRTIRGWVLGQHLSISTPAPSLELDRRNLLVFSRTIAAIYAFFHALGIQKSVQRRGGHIYYAVRDLPPYRMHIYAVHLTPGAPLRDIRHLLSIADHLLALGALPTRGMKRPIPVLIPGPGKWMDAAFREIPSLEDFLLDTLKKEASHGEQTARNP